LRRPLVAALAVVGLLALGVTLSLLVRRDAPLPEGLEGSLVYVSDRGGVDSLFVRHLPAPLEIQLTWLGSPVSHPRVAHDGGRAAYAVGGRIELVHLTTGDTVGVSLGVDWRDAHPAWRPDGRALVVMSRSGEGSRSDLHLLELRPGGALAGRRALTDTPGVEESEPIFSPDAETVIYASQGGLYELDLESGLTQRLTRGLQEAWGARFLPGGDLIWLWREGKRVGIDRLSSDGARRTLRQGAVAYRSLAPSPDGDWLVATLGLDLGFRLSQLLKPHPTEELHLLDVEGQLVAPLASAWGYSNPSADWGR
jgi:Tol biopolymer transport system component